jgi:heat shock protein HslJ
MTTLDDRFASLQRSPAPDLWQDIERRQPSEPPASGPATPRRLTAAAVALVVAVAAIAFVLRAFDARNVIPVESVPVPAVDLDGTSWVLTTVDGEPAVRGTEDRWMTLGFDDGEYRATSGCNRISGGYDIESGSFRSTDIGEWVTCGPGVSSEEQAFFNMLGMRADATLRGASLMLTDDEHQFQLVQDPCSLLTHQEVADAVGGGVRSSGLVPPSRMKIPGAGPVCSYDVPTTRFSSVGVQIETSTLERFESQAAEDEANFMDVPGVGEQAYISGMGSIVVLDGDREIEIGVQHGAGDAAIPVLEALGRAAVDVASSAASPSASAAVSASTRDVFAAGSDALAGKWRLFVEETEFGPVFGVILPDAQTFTSELVPIGDRTFGNSHFAWASNGSIVLVQIVGPSVERVQVRLDDGRVATAAVATLPDGFGRPARVAVVGIPSEVTAEGQQFDPDGDVVAFRADGHELDQRRLSSG